MTDNTSQTHPEFEPDSIVIQHKHESRIDTRLFARRIGIKHKNLYELVLKYKTELRQFGTLPFQTERLKTEHLGERKHKYALLNESQFDFMSRIVRGGNAEKIIQFKLDVTKAFAKKRATEPLRREYLPHYHSSRDALRDLGAQRHHYIHLANAENRMTGLSAGERQCADEHQLGVLICMQKIEQSTFQSAIDAGMSPSEAVREVSKRMDAFASLMMPTVRIGG